MIIFRKYKSEDWSKIDDAVEPFMFTESLDEFNKAVRRGVAVTAVEDDVIMSCGGVAYVNDKEGIVWVKVSRKCLNHSYKWARTIRETFKIMMNAIGSMIVTTYILEKFCKGEKLARLIGMKRDGETYEFNGNKYNRYSVVIQ